MDNHAVIFIVVSLLIHFCYKTLLIPVYNAGINLDVHSNLICHRFHSVIVIHKSRLLRLVCTCNLCPRCRDISVRAITKCNLSRFVIKGTHIFRPLLFQGIYDSPCRPRHRYRSAVLHNRNPVHIAFLIWISVTVRCGSPPVCFLCYVRRILVVGCLPCCISHDSAVYVGVYCTQTSFPCHPVILPHIAELISHLKANDSIRLFMPILCTYRRPVHAAARIASVIGCIQIFYQVRCILGISPPQTIDKDCL